MQIYEKKLHLSSLLERAGSELGLVEDVLVAEYGPEVPVPVDGPHDREPAMMTRRRGRRRRADGTELETVPFDREQQQKRLAAAERKLAQLGRVNPLALEEFAALEQRHKFLTEQLADLTNTRKDLLTIIEEIDEKMQDIFAVGLRRHAGGVRRRVPDPVPGRHRQHHLTDPETCSPPASRCR